MKVAFVVPQSNIPNRDLIGIDLGVLYLAGTLCKEEIDVKILDSILWEAQGATKEASSQRLLSELIAYTPDWVCIKVFTNHWHIVKDLCKKIKELCFHTKIVLGGPHITSCPESFVECKEADYGIKGEGEEVLIKLLTHPEDACKIRGVIKSTNGYLHDSSVHLTNNLVFLNLPGI